MRYRLGRIIGFASLCALCAGLAVGNYVCFGVVGADFITQGLSGTGVTTGDQESQEKGEKLVKKISEDGTVLLKNENHTLPLDITSSNKVNVFGYTSLDNAWVYTGVGSGSCLPDPEKRLGIIRGLEKAGFEVNKDLEASYSKAIPTNDKWFSNNNYGKLIQPDTSFYTTELINSCKEFSDTAIVVLSRVSGENCGDYENPDFQTDYLSGNTDYSRSYLQISQKEEEMLEIVKSNFDKVIVLLNTTNNMVCDFLNDEKIDAALYVGPTGLCGTESVGNLLAGRKITTDENGEEQETLISPSGHLADTYAYNYTIEPSYANKNVRNKSATGGNIVYQEGIYFGYRWYETADVEGFFSGLDHGYDSAVQYPFGYGLSYTDFSWKLKSCNYAENTVLDKDSKVEMVVEVTNVGDYPGKDVVQLYVTSPYTKGGIEKSSVVLADFAKTSLLKPGETQEVTLTLDAYSLASYDCYDANEDGFSGYELEKGDYAFRLQTDSHHLKEMDENEFTLKVDEDIHYSKDPTTGYDVINRFTGEDASAWVPIDGSTVGINETYLSRSSFAKTFKDSQSKLPTETKAISEAKNYMTSAMDQEVMPTFGADNGLSLTRTADSSKSTKDQLVKGKGLTYDDELVDELMNDLDSPKWDLLLNQLTVDEATALVERSGFGSDAIASIGKPKTLDFDGPSGFNQNTIKMAEDFSSWTSYPCECVVGCTWNEALAYEIGQSVAFEADKSGITGWYAPGVNLHRSNYNGRNYEYYSEDPIISGKLASATIKGAKSGGLYCYLKHFVVSEEGNNPKGVDTWLTEQALREMYLKPFEIAVKAGANAIMTAFNCLGPVWCGASYELCTEILRNEWGFEGSIVTDWSSGDNIMNPTRGVRAGNDLWLDPMDTNYAPLNRKDPTSMYCAKLAVKHNLITYLDTYRYARDYTDENNEYQVIAGIKTAGQASSWWIPTLISIDVLFALGTAFMGLYTFLPYFNKPKA